MQLTGAQVKLRPFLLSVQCVGEQRLCASLSAVLMIRKEKEVELELIVSNFALGLIVTLVKVYHLAQRYIEQRVYSCSIEELYGPTSY